MHTGNIDNPETGAGRVYNVLKGHYGEMEKWRDSLKRINTLLEEAVANEKRARAELNTAVAYIHAKHEQRCRDMKKKPTHDEEFERVLAEI